MKLQWLTHFCFSILYQPPGYMYCLCFKTLKSFIVLNTTFSNISAISLRPVLVVEETGVPLYHLRLRVECTFFSSSCQRQCELLSSLGIRRLLTFHILIFSSETPQPLLNSLGKIF
jgi:hypothetical protein